MKKLSFVFLLIPFLFSVKTFASEIDEPSSDVSSSDPAPVVIILNQNNETEDGSEEASSQVATIHFDSNSADYSVILESIYQNSVSSNDLISSLQEEVLRVNEHKDFTLYSSADELEESEFYVDRYQLEIYKLLKYCVILLACNVGIGFVQIFVHRSHKNGSS